MAQKGGSRKADERDLGIVQVSAEFTAMDHLRMALIRPEDKRTVDDRRRIKAARTTGMDLDAIRSLTPEGITSYLETVRPRKGNGAQGRPPRIPKEGMLPDTRRKSSVESAGDSMGSDVGISERDVRIDDEITGANFAIQGGENSLVSDVPDIENTTVFEDPMEQIAAVWREMNEQRSGGEQILFQVLTSDEPVRDEGADEVSTVQSEAADSLRLNFDRPGFSGKPKRDVFAVSEESPIIDPWNRGRENEAVFRIPRLPIDASQQQGLADSGTISSNGVERNVFVITEDDLNSSSSELGLGAMNGESVDLLDYVQPAAFVTPPSEGGHFSGTHRHKISHEPRPLEPIPPFDGRRIAGILNARILESKLHSGEIARRTGELR